MHTPPARYDEATRRRGLEDIVRRALAEAKRLGASAAEAGIGTSTGLDVNVRLGEVETIEHTRDRALDVTVYFGHRKGSASTTDFALEAVCETVAAACGIARHTSEDECNGLADAALMATELPDLDLHHPWALGPEQAIELATEAEDAARAVDRRITNSEGAAVNRHEGEHVYGNSHGFLAGCPSTRHGISCVLIAEEGGGMQRDHWFSTSRDPGALEAPAAIGRRAAERTLRRLGAKRLSTRTAPVLFAAEVATGLFRHLVAAVSGGNLYRRSSFLLDAAGTRVFPDFVRIHEQPHLPGALGSAAFDGEGVATRARDLVAGGVLQGYVLSSYSARRLGLVTTGNAGGVHNLTVDAGPDLPGFTDLLREMGRGLLVTELMGMGVNITTGDYSRGASGFWVENGEIACPVEEITVAGNLRDMFLDLRRMGNDTELRGNLRCGSVLIGEMTIAGD